MIFGNIQNLKEYFFLEDGVFECFRYAKENDLSKYEKGSHEIDGKRLFVNIVEYETVEAEKRFWEAHKDYLDIHLMLDGAEQIDLNFIQNMDVKDYVPEGDFLICYPSDAHRTAVAVDGSEKIKKAIFKLQI